MSDNNADVKDIKNKIADIGKLLEKIKLDKE